MTVPLGIDQLLSHSKAIFAAFSGLLTLLIGRFAAPFEDDMPFPLRPVLVCLCCAEVFVMPIFAKYFGPVPAMVGLVAAVVFLLLVYIGAYALYGYKKTVTIRRPILFWRTTNKEALILGGLKLAPGAQGDDLQDYFERCGFEQDKVWTRGSRFFVQAVAVLSYTFLIIVLIGILALASGIGIQ